PDRPSGAPDRRSGLPDRPNDVPDARDALPDRPSAGPDRRSGSPDRPNAHPDRQNARADRPSSAPDGRNTAPDRTARPGGLRSAAGAAHEGREDQREEERAGSDASSARCGAAAAVARPAVSRVGRVAGVFDRARRDADCQGLAARLVARLAARAAALYVGDVLGALRRDARHPAAAVLADAERALAAGAALAVGVTLAGQRLTGRGPVAEIERLAPFGARVGWRRDRVGRRARADEGEGERGKQDEALHALDSATGGRRSRGRLALLRTLRFPAADVFVVGVKARQHERPKGAGKGEVRRVAL